jgi:hypothetical protein
MIREHDIMAVDVFAFFLLYSHHMRSFFFLPSRRSLSLSCTTLNIRYERVLFITISNILDVSTVVFNI